MATTRLLTIHINKGKTVAQTLSERTDYAQNSEKTVDKPIGKILADSKEPDEQGRRVFEHADALTACESVGSTKWDFRTNYAMDTAKTYGGELVKCYACAPQTVDEEFMLSKKEYEYKTARDQGKRNVLAYHIRQAFKPGEIEPQEALEIGYELAMRFTKGQHAFIVATHTDKAHVHNHIVFNSTALSCDRKFRDFKRSGMAIRRISDLLCIEHGLSVIENPGQSKGKNYAKWLGSKEPSWQDKLRQKIDEVLPNCTSFEDFIGTMKSAGYIVNDKCKHITFLAIGQKKPTRLDTLKGEYMEEAIRERIAKRVITPVASKTAPIPVPTPVYNSTITVSWPGRSAKAELLGNASLLIDIQAKIQEGKGVGYEHWSRVFNIKEMAKTLLYLKENGIDSYDELVKKTDVSSKKFTAVSNKIKSIENRLKEISELQRQIGTYGKTRETYVAYKKSGYNQNFYETNRANIALHEAAKKHFNSLGIKKLPKISELKQEYATLQAEKKKLYVDYHTYKKSIKELLVAKSNAEQILGIKPNVKPQEINREI